MKKLASIMILVFSMGACAFSFHPSQQYSEEGEKIDSGRYVILIVSSSFTAYGTFAVE